MTRVSELLGRTLANFVLDVGNYDTTSAFFEESPDRRATESHQFGFRGCGRSGEQGDFPVEPVVESVGWSRRHELTFTGIYVARQMLLIHHI